MKIKFPISVGKVFESRGDLDKAIAHYQDATDIERCKKKRGDYIYDQLKKKFYELKEDKYQKQALAYILILELELKLRDLIRTIFNKNKTQMYWWNEFIPPAEKKYGEEEFKKYHENPYFEKDQKLSERIDFLTLAQLISVITYNDKNWKLFEPCFNNQTIFNGTMEILKIIRNDIAHARFLSQDKLTRLIQGITDISRAVDTYLT